MVLQLTSPERCIKMVKGSPDRLDVNETVAWIKENVPVRTVLETGEILTYRQGIYIAHGEQYVSRILAETFGGINKINDVPIYNRHVKAEILTRLRDTTYTRIIDFDADLDMINMKSGLYNWKSGELNPHTPDYYSRIQIPVEYDSTAVCLNIDKMIEMVARPEDVAKCYEFMAYCLYREYPIQKLVVLFGPGNTGKSYFMDVIKTMLGQENCASVSMQDLAQDRFATSDLYKKSANICGDLDETALKQAGILKQLTSNKDLIRAQRKGERAFQFVNYAKMIFAANKLPSTSDDTTGFYRRFEIIPFLHVFKESELDQEFLDSLVSPWEISGLFNMVVALLPDLLGRNTFTNQLSIEEAKTMYKDRSKPEGSFFDKFVHEMPGQWTVKKTLHMYYAKYCEKVGVPAMSMNAFGRYITKNIDWIQKRAIREDKGDQRSNFSTRIDGKTVAAWPDTYFDLKAFNEWQDAL